VNRVGTAAAAFTFEVDGLVIEATVLQPEIAPATGVVAVVLTGLGAFFTAIAANLVDCS
jgi:hypothetical protein